MEYSSLYGIHIGEEFCLPVAGDMCIIGVFFEQGIFETFFDWILFQKISKFFIFQHSTFSTFSILLIVYFLFLTFGKDKDRIHIAVSHRKNLGLYVHCTCSFREYGTYTY